MQPAMRKQEGARLGVWGHLGRCLKMAKKSESGKQNLSGKRKLQWEELPVQRPWGQNVLGMFMMWFSVVGGERNGRRRGRGGDRPRRALWARCLDRILSHGKLPGDFMQRRDFPLAVCGN